MTIPSDHRPTLTGQQTWATAETARNLVPTRDFGAHKWGVGGVIVVAGSPSYPGAALLTSRAAGRAGAGIVQLASGRGVIATVAASIPEVAHIPLPETDAPGAARRALERIEEHLEKTSAILIGPGLGRDNAASELLSALFALGSKRESERRNIGFSSLAATESDEPKGSTSPLFDHEKLTIVVDADALNWLSDQGEWWKAMPSGRLLLTPHVGEFSKLTGKSVDEIIADPLDELEAAARLWQQTVVLKYGFTAVSDGTRTIVAEDAPLSLATAGSGDVLAGTIAGFAGQGLNAIDAATLALHVGPAAARLVEKRFGTLGLIASDLPDAIAESLAALSSNA
jgi:NAD(P)H-hydrate repair Nnr-like enzyme with NAD(P)H-hydrate dehydratase domain